MYIYTLQRVSGLKGSPFAMGDDLLIFIERSDEEKWRDHLDQIFFNEAPVTYTRKGFGQILK